MSKRVPQPLPRDCVQCGKRFTPMTQRKRYCDIVCSRRGWKDGAGKEKYKAALKKFNQSDKAKSWRKSNQPLVKARKYGLTVEKLNQIIEEGCYAPGCNIVGAGRTGLHIDHDHSCCPGKKSCGRCVRGALCRKHNIALGYIEEDLLFAIWVTRNPMFILKIRREA